MNYKMLRDFFRTAPPVYASIAALAAENRTREQLSCLKAAQRRFCKAVSVSDPDLMAYHNNDFHLIIGEMVDNQYLWPSLQRLSIKQQNSEQAKQLALDHWDLSRDHIEMFVRAAPLEINLAVA